VGLRTVAASLLACAALSGCGSAGAPSAASTEPLAPAGTLIYLELTVRPQGNQRADVESALTRLLGHSPDAAIQRAVARLSRRAGLSYQRDLAPWLGQHVALVVRSFSPGGFGLIAPTGDPSAGLRALQRVERGAHLRPARYAGVGYQVGSDRGSPVAIGIVGHSAVIAGPPTFTAIVDAYHGRSIATDPAFASAIAALPPAALVKGYLDASALAGAVRGALGSLPGVGGLPAGVLGQVDAALRRLHGALTFAVSAGSRSFSVDLHRGVARPAAPADVSAAPEASWLALASSGPGRGAGLGLVGAALEHSPAGQALLARIRSRTGLDLIHDILPALGPLRISVQGTSLLSLGAGLVMTPADLAAAGRLLAGIHRLAARSSGLTVKGGDRAFSIAKAGLPIPRVLVALLGRRLVATVDESFAALLSPPARLASNPDFTRALRSLPAASRASVFLDFRALGTLLGQIPSLASPRDRRILQVLARLDYLIAGSDGRSDTRVVLALR